MSDKDINSKAFDEGTLLKLNIFRESFREWLPVFLYGKGIERICIYDLFAGSGYDTEGNPGSPMILLDEVRGNNRQYCSLIRRGTTPKVIFGFNEKEKVKSDRLRENVTNYRSACAQNCPLGSEGCCLGAPFIKSMSFEDITQSKTFKTILQDEKTAKFILLDQYGIKEITENIFLSLISCPKADFIFFISTSTIRRFANHDAIKKYFATEKIDFDNTEPKECHRLLAEYYRSLIPENIEYYLHSFTIKKGSNYYGLIFGSSHSLGMEKFLRVCWKYDKYSGDSNCNLDDDEEWGELFQGASTHHKIDAVKAEIESLILAEKIRTNKEGLHYALRRGCLPSVYVDTIKDLIKRGVVKIIGKFNAQSTKIHQVDEYQIALS